MLATAGQDQAIWYSLQDFKSWHWIKTPKSCTRAQCSNEQNHIAWISDYSDSQVSPISILKLCTSLYLCFLDMFHLLHRQRLDTEGENI